ncbi:MAG: tetratricopeptide (TPR) repeat protein [Halioglobus sp.]|jgi:tetratricopeptide (TPR) repeat protein
MKRYEKIILIIFSIVLILQPFAFPGKGALFILATWLLSASYLFGGYWLFEAKENKRVVISIISGIVLSSSLFNLPHLIWRYNESFYNFLPIANGLLFISLLGFLFLKRNSETNLRSIKLIFVRSLIILAVSSFFTYTPISFKPLRAILYSLNSGRVYIQANLRTFDYIEECEDALDKGECERAFQFALQANEAGKTWLRIPLEKQKDSLNSAEVNLIQVDSSQSQLWKISRTYSNLYQAYKCKADVHYKNKQYDLALNYFLKADKALSNYVGKSEYWKIQQVQSKNILALCYKELYNYEYADSLFVEAIEQYVAIKDTTDRNVATFYSNLAESMFEQLQFGYSNVFYKESIVILQRDTTNEENKKSIIGNYLSLIKNHLQADSLEQAMFFIEETFKRVDKATVDFCNTNLYYGLYFYKLSKYKQADDVLTDCLDCHKKLLESTNQNIAENHLALALVKIALAEYDLAKNNLDNGIEITTKNYGKNSSRYANYLKAYAHLDKELSNYEKAEQVYYQVLETYNKELGERNMKIPEVLSGLADLEIILAKFVKAKTHSDSSISIANYFVNLDSPGTTSLINNAAYVNYYIGNYNISDSLYQQTLKINKDFELQSTATSAFALNGLGLIMTAKKEYKKADSLFIRTLKLHKKIFTENHPITAVIYLNYANLKIEENKLKQAKKMLTISKDINKRFFDHKHDIFADIYVAYGDIAKRERRREKAREYYQKALDIYLGKFDEEHIRVKSTKEKIKGSN